VKTLQPRHRLTVITDRGEIASSQRGGLHDIDAIQAKDGTWWASSCSVEKYRRMIAARREAEIERGYVADSGAET
jgi:hypothetical protein